MAKRYYQMLWDCPYCGAKGLLAKDQKVCPNCGGEQDASKRYFPELSKAQEVVGHVVKGVDRICPHCKKVNAVDASICPQCGGSMTDAEAVERIASPQGQAPPPPAPGGPGRIPEKWYAAWGVASFFVSPALSIVLFIKKHYWLSLFGLYPFLLLLYIGFSGMGKEAVNRQWDWIGSKIKRFTVRFLAAALILAFLVNPHLLQDSYRSSLVFLDRHYSQPTEVLFQEKQWHSYVEVNRSVRKSYTYSCEAPHRLDSRNSVAASFFPLLEIALRDEGDGTFSVDEPEPAKNTGGGAEAGGSPSPMNHSPEWNSPTQEAPSGKTCEGERYVDVVVRTETLSGDSMPIKWSEPELDRYESVGRKWVKWQISLTDARGNRMGTCDVSQQLWLSATPGSRFLLPIGKLGHNLQCQDLSLAPHGK